MNAPLNLSRRDGIEHRRADDTIGHRQREPAQFSAGRLRARRSGARRRVPGRRCAPRIRPNTAQMAMPHGWVDNPLVFVAIGEDGIVSIVCHRSEMGQGVRTGMPMIVADELEADWTRVRVVQAPGDEARYGNQDTDGSRSTRHFFMPMRRCGAAARQMLEAAAAARWKVPVERRAGEERRGRAHSHRPAPRLRRARQGSGEHAAACSRCDSAQGSCAISLHRHRQAEARRRAGHRHRQGTVRHGYAPARHALCGHRATAGAAAARS